MVNLYQDVKHFNENVVNLDVPPRLNSISVERRRWFLNVVEEEVNEFIKAHVENNLEEQVNALIDLTYFTLGRLVEMGLTEKEFYHCWNEVQKANMRKKKGDKQRGSNIDAIKPKTWCKPNLNLNKNK